jgi:tetratricopeptide (TPR) repeat protein
MCIQGDFTGAIRVLDQVLACDPNHIGALLGTGDTRRLQGDLDQARELYDQALEINPHCVHVLARMSTLRHDMEKRRQKAEKELLDILEAEEEQAKQRKSKRERKKKRRNEKRQAHIQAGQSIATNLTAAFDAAGTKMTAAERVAAFEAAGGMESVFGPAEDAASTSGEDDQPLCFETLLEQMKIEEQNQTSSLNHAAYNTSSEVFSVAWAC